MSETIGERLYRLREKKALRPEAVAAACGVTARTVRNWENDQTDPGVSHVEALCSVLGVTPAVLVFGREKGRAACQ